MQGQIIEEFRDLRYVLLFVKLILKFPINKNILHLYLFLKLVALDAHH